MSFGILLEPLSFLLACWYHPFGCLWPAWAVCGLSLLLLARGPLRGDSFGSRSSFKRAARSLAKTGSFFMFFGYRFLVCVREALVFSFR